MRAGRTRPLLALAAVVVITAATFWPVQQHAFLNWDDPEALVANPHLRQSAGALLTWAFSTLHMGHYQPLSWLTFAALGGAPIDPGRVHGLALWLHVVNAGLLLLVAARLADRGDGDGRHWVPAAAATALFAVHPLRVEPVAWASALPYVLSYALLLLSVAAWITWTRGGRSRWLWSALACYAVSQLARVTAPLLPLVLVLMAWADRRARPRSPGALLRAVVPFALVAVPLGLAEAGARDVETLGDVGLASRIAAALASPAIYLWHTLAPVALNPLAVLPRAAPPDWGAAALGVVAGASVVTLTWRLAGHRVAIAVWGSYLLLLLPILGLTPSGVQATADRYTYGPAMVLTVALAAMLASASVGARRALVATAGAVAILFAVSARAQVAYWHDSIALWSRAVALDADNDIALYNLALARIDAGDPGRAIEHLQRLVALVPDHEVGRRRLATLVGEREQTKADRAAAAGRFAEAVASYDRAIDADPARMRARLNRGMALLELGQVARASADLEAAIGGGLDDPAAVNALAFAWARGGRGAEAIALLRGAQKSHPNDITVAGNLARLLVTVDPPGLREPDAALAVASAINEATGGRDPRVLDTLALALAATGRAPDAAQAWDAAINIATAAGDRGLAAELGRRRAALAR